MTIERSEIPQPVTQSENKIAISALIKKFTFHRLISQTSKKAILDTVKKRKQISPLKQSTYYEVYISIISLFISNLTSYVQVLTKYYEYLTNLVKLKVLNNDEKYLIFINRLRHLLYGPLLLLAVPIPTKFYL